MLLLSVVMADVVPEVPAPLRLRQALDAAAAAAAAKGSNLSVTAEALADAFSQRRLSLLVKTHASAYWNAQPFPHTVIDAIVPESVAQALSAEMPEKAGKSRHACVADADFCIHQRGREDRKSALQDERKMKPVTLMVFWALKSLEFTNFLRRLTGIERPLIADPEYNGAGASFVASGGRLNLHADFNKYRKFDLDRRVNTFIYLNEDWPDAYGGHLELWDRNLTSCVQRILPGWNRFVVFSTTDFSWHGHPQPLPCPRSRMRRSLAMYYYSRGRPDHECQSGNCKDAWHHGTIHTYPKVCERCEEEACRAFDAASVGLPRG